MSGGGSGNCCPDNNNNFKECCRNGKFLNAVENLTARGHDEDGVRTQHSQIIVTAWTGTVARHLMVVTPNCFSRCTKGLIRVMLLFR